MGELTEEEFASWLHPCDVLEYYHQQQELNPKALVTGMLADGLLRAGATQFILNGRDHGLALIRREVWPLAAMTEVWTTGRFRLTHLGRDGDITMSAYDVRVDPELQTLPEPGAPSSPAKAQQSSKPRRGGRPPAAWWDELWAEIGRQLYAGDLKPESQAAIERAMNDWLAAKGYDAGETTVRARARLLFRALSSEDEN